MARALVSKTRGCRFESCLACQPSEDTIDVASLGNLSKRGADLFKGLQTYLHESAQETKKVTWPDRKYVMAATALVLVIVLLVTLLIMGIDSLFAWLFGILLKTPRS